MGFLKGFITAIPIAIYFGEHNIRYPIVYQLPQNKEQRWGHFIIDLRFMDHLEKTYK